MTNDLLAEIRRRLNEYLTGSASLDEFRDWFEPETWDVDASTSAETQILAHQIEHRIAEFTDGAWTEAELRDHFVNMLPGEVALTANRTATFTWTSATEGPLVGSSNSMATPENPVFLLERAFTLEQIPA